MLALREAGGCSRESGISGKTGRAEGFWWKKPVKGLFSRRERAATFLHYPYFMLKSHTPFTLLSSTIPVGK